MVTILKQWCISCQKCQNYTKIKNKLNLCDEIMVMMTTTMTTVTENHFLSNASAAHS
jgi:hypothetical protein